ncbi:MAG TPA: AEC family transporter [Candidatus Dojkabacteria bacterium]|nr:AEC family transporter [Candidatus Dojkabacteria bacterium]HRP51091.1 AEC family transporter [Candidatus Dojkabacteria bacterium]
MNVLESLLPLIIIAIIGFIVGQTKILPKEFPKEVNKFLFYVALPIFLLGSFSDFNRSDVKDLIPYILVNILIISVLYVTYYVVINRTKLDKKDVASTITPSFVGNSIYFGFPVLTTVLGSEYIPYGVIYVSFVTTVDFLGMFLTSKLTGKSFDAKKQLQKFIKTPLLIASFIGFIFMLTNVALPQIVLDITQSFGSIIGPLIFISFGMSFSYKAILGNIRLPLVVAFNKLILLPLATYLVVYYIFPLPEIAAQASVVIACMPSAFFNLVIADNYDTNKDITIASILLNSMLFFIVSIFWISLIT